MVLVHDTSSRRGLQVYQVSLKNFNGFQVIQRTRNCIENNQREITPKILKLELWFLCMTSSRRGLQVYQVSLKNL